MRVLIIDQENQALDFVLRAAGSSHDVRWFMDNKRPVKDGKGFRGFDIVSDWRGSMAWAMDGLIFATGNSKYINEFDRYRDLGFKIFAPTKKSAALEINRAAGMEALKQAGIEVPAYQTFSSLEAAAKYARKKDQCFVFKTLGDEEDKSLSYVSCDPADMVGWIERKIAKGMTLKGPCMLQEKIDMLCEFGVSGWMGPEGFLPDKWQICFEHKKLMNGEIGPQTGEMGSVCAYSETEKLADEMLKPLELQLIKLGHRGDCAIGAGIDTKGKAWPFELTQRAGWPAFFIQVASHKNEDPVQWMRDLLDGKDTLKVDKRVAIGVVMAQPQFPYGKSKPEDVEGSPISGIDDVDEDAVHPIGMMMERGPKMVDGSVTDAMIPMTTGEYVMCVTGLGKTVEAARKSVYGSISKIRYCDSLYRTDIGEKLEPVLPKLRAFGYAEGMMYSDAD